MSQEAAAKDRFDVQIEMLHFYAYYDTTPSGISAVHEYDLHVDIEGIGRRTIKGQFRAKGNLMASVWGKAKFQNIEEPKRSNRQIKFSSKVVRDYTVGTSEGTDYLGRASGVTKGDLFRESDHSRDDTASETVAVRTRDYVFYVRVTVIEVD
jgi:hypothetical protein